MGLTGTHTHQCNQGQSPIASQSNRIPLHFMTEMLNNSKMHQVLPHKKPIWVQGCSARFGKAFLSSVIATRLWSLRLRTWRCYKDVDMSSYTNIWNIADISTARIPSTLRKGDSFRLMEYIPEFFCLLLKSIH